MVYLNRRKFERVSKLCRGAMVNGACAMLTGLESYQPNLSSSFGPFRSTNWRSCLLETY